MCLQRKMLLSIMYYCYVSQHDFQILLMSDAEKPSTDFSRPTISSVPEGNIIFFTLFCLSFIFQHIAPVSLSFQKMVCCRYKVAQTGLTFLRIKDALYKRNDVPHSEFVAFPLASKVTWINGNRLMEPTRRVCSLEGEFKTGLQCQGRMEPW